jgi:hypothetical protein
LGGLSSAVDIVIQNGHISDVSNISTTEVGSVIVNAGGQLMNSSNSNRYMNVFGDITCNGVIGDGYQYNAISFNIEGDTCIVSGSGQFDCSRIRKNSNANLFTVLKIQMEVRLWYEQFSGVAFYNNSYGARFDLIIEPSGSLRLLGATGLTSFSMDGTTGSGLFDNHGMVDVRGTLDIGGILYMSNNNSDPADSCIIMIRNSGVLRAGSVDASPGVISKSTIRVEGGAIFELKGGAPFLNFSLTTNDFDLDENSLTRYSCNCDQIINSQLNYGDLELTGQAFKVLQDTTSIKGDLFITGNAISVGGSSTVELMGDWVSQVSEGWVSESAEIVLSGASDQSIVTSGLDSISSLVIFKPGGRVILNDSLVITRDLFLTQGIMVTSDSAILKIDSSASVYGHSYLSYVDGPMIRYGESGFDFPIGDSVHYKPIYIGAATKSHMLKVNYVRKDPMDLGYDVNLLDTGLDHVSRCELWEITSLDTVSSVIGLTWDSSSCGITHPASLRMARWNGSLWLNDHYSSITGVSTQGQIFSLTGVPLLNDSTVCVTLGASSAGQNPLPVTMLSFKLQHHNDGILAKWSTATEVNTSHFLLEKLNKEGTFVFLSLISAAGNSSTVSDYSFIDTAPFSGINCYRLTQFDLNGDSTGYQPECIVLKHQSDLSVCFPNPVFDVIRLPLSSFDSQLSLSIIDATGQLWLQTEIEPESSKGMHWVYETSHLPSGIYNLLVVSNDEILQTCRFIVL